MSSACCVRGASVIYVVLYRTSNQVDDLAKFFAKLHIIYINRKLRRLFLILFKIVSAFVVSCDYGHCFHIANYDSMWTEFNGIEIAVIDLFTKKLNSRSYYVCSR